VLWILKLIRSFLSVDLPICYECLSATPTVWCLNCSVEYCSGCWKRIHKGRALSNHHKVPIDQKPREYQRCTIHPDEKLQYWCNCDTLICVDCQLTKQHQHHSTISVVDAAQDIIEQVCRKMFLNVKNNSRKLIF